MSDCYIVRHGGGGAELNFKIVGGTKPLNPKENTIWIDDPLLNKVGEYQINTMAAPISRIDGTPLQENDVSIGWSRSVPDRTMINLIKKNAIFSRLGQVNVRHGNVWARKNAEVYVQGAWKAFSSSGLHLYELHNWCEAVTGGWVGTKRGFADSSYKPHIMTPIMAKSGEMEFGLNDPSFIGSMCTKNKIDLTDATTLYFKGSAKTSNVNFCVWSANTGNVQNGQAAFGRNEQTKNYTIAIDVSKLKGSYYVGAYCWGGDSALVTECYWI